jgi:hypothetical protein
MPDFSSRASNKKAGKQLVFSPLPAPVVLANLERDIVVEAVHIGRGLLRGTLGLGGL